MIVLLLCEMKVNKRMGLDWKKKIEFGLCEKEELNKHSTTMMDLFVYLYRSMFNVFILFF